MTPNPPHPLNEPPTLKDIEAARDRIAPYIRHTPLVPAIALKDAIPGCPHLWLKLDCLQVTGSFKVRGAVNTLKSLSQDELQRGIITASGGNHGLAVAYAGWLAQVPATIYLGSNVPPAKAEKLRQWGAEVVFEGHDWDDANRAAMAVAESHGLTYIHPFNDPRVMAGQGTLALEILADLPQVDTLLVAIGGGGLMSGVSLAAKALKPNIRIVGIEPVGAPTLKASVAAGKILELEATPTLANTLAPRKTEPLNFEIIRHHVDQFVLVSDEEMAEACRWLWFELGVAAELSGGAAIAALMTHQYQPQPSEVVCALICGTGTAGL
ncbi:threonine/serine dehydratase [Leptolyngbya sp. CCNP1308]|uniref:threonine ammonia-lyase n=1 Tax=Leptolyngbya sp. CCNP1308 TaxID=3110255 RepID=UPI002B202183|nr:threonine/serine dehydratase [Leptolyngbya sp. CCNP1308]MEA5447800.1 threonine/serine dehydratase [Leptolyngbya sp. CCNP1308]